MGKKMVGHQNRLCVLHVRTAGHDGIPDRLCLSNECGHHLEQFAPDDPRLITQVHANESGNLIVAGPPGTKPASEMSSGAFEKAAFQSGVDIFIVRTRGEGTRGHIGVKIRKGGQHPVQFHGGQQPGMCQSSCMRARTGNVVMGETPVELGRAREFGQGIGRAAGEAPAPQCDVFRHVSIVGAASDTFLPAFTPRTHPQAPHERSYTESMSFQGRSFLKESDFTPSEWAAFVDLAATLKSEHRSGTERQRLAGKSVALIFEKTSTRTRCAFEVAAFQQGAHTTYLDPNASQIGHKESIADTARVLGRFYDAIEFRGDHQVDVEALAEYSGVPVFNGLTDEWHPTQMLADALTIREHVAKPLTEVVHAFVGDGRFNTGRSTLVSSAMLGMDIRIVAPKEFQPDAEAVAIAERYAAQTGAKVTITDDVVAGVKGADVISTDIWVSMGEPKEVWKERAATLHDYQVNRELMEATGNPGAIFMHCLPAFHDLDTVVGRDVFELTGMEGLEVTDEVFESERSVVFDQAENRMHTIKAVLVAALADPARI